MYLIIGVFEILGAVGLLIPRTSAIASVGLIIIMVGALFTHLTHNEMTNAILPFAVIVLLVFIAFVRNPFRKA